MKVLVPGGAGYVGAMLVPWLMNRGHQVTVYDSFIFGSAGLPEDSARLTVIKGDVRHTDLFRTACEGKDAVIYLAGITNNDLCNENPPLSDDVNIHAFNRAVPAARVAGVKRFIFASSVAAYGSSDSELKESDPLKPSTLYGHAKDKCEAWLLAHQQEDFTTTIVRSASVCGYSPRMRFDITLNKMAHDAHRKGVITVNGGQQKRSHVNMLDLCDFYALLLDLGTEHIAGQAFNVVAENQTVLDSARMVSDVFQNTPDWPRKVAIDVGPRADNRSYAVDGTKARKLLGFQPKRSGRQGVVTLKAHFDSGRWQDSLTNKAYMNFADGLV